MRPSSHTATPALTIETRIGRASLAELPRARTAKVSGLALNSLGSNAQRCPRTSLTLKSLLLRLALEQIPSSIARSLRRPRKDSRSLPHSLLQITRRILPTLALSAALGFALTVCAAPKSAPNVVLITLDTLRADHLGCYGYKLIQTPNLDSLAAAGARFADAYTPIPITLPSHSVILTGTYPMRNGMHDFSDNRLSSSLPTLASILHDHGYATAAVIGSAVLDSRFGLNRGFDFYYDHFDFNRLQESNLEEMERPGNVVADVTLDWLRKNYSKKFFLWMHLYDPHYPYQPPAPYDAEYKDRPYDGEIAFADQQVGRLIRFLKSKGLFANTMIILSGDHGESLGEHGEKSHGFFIY